MLLMGLPGAAGDAPRQCIAYLLGSGDQPFLACSNVLAEPYFTRILFTLKYSLSCFSLVGCRWWPLPHMWGMLSQGSSSLGGGGCGLTPRVRGRAGQQRASQIPASFLGGSLSLPRTQSVLLACVPVWKPSMEMRKINNKRGDWKHIWPLERYFNAHDTAFFMATLGSPPVTPGYF